MTRFARASGSKGANEKQPEEATSWSALKSSLLRKEDNHAVKEVYKYEPEPPSTDEIKSVWAELVADTEKTHTKVVNKSISKSKAVGKGSAGDDDFALPINSNKKTKGCRKDKNSFAESKTEKRNGETVVADEVPVKKRKKQKMINAIEDEERALGHNWTKKRSTKKSEQKSTKINETKKNSQHTVKSNKVELVVAEPKTKMRRKEPLKSSEVIINGSKVVLAPFDGFMIQAEDAVRLQKLRQDMKKKGIPFDQREAAIKLERRRAEKALARLKKRVCFHCRGSGHNLSECPQVKEGEQSTGICFKCGSTEHTHFQCKVNRQGDFPFAQCFICKEQGHIAKQCPENPRGLYPNGGGCALCLDVTHLKKDCPQYLVEKEQAKLTVGTRNDRSLEALEDDFKPAKVAASSGSTKKQNKRVEF